jgi:hypothetical protein
VKQLQTYAFGVVARNKAPSLRRHGVRPNVTHPISEKALVAVGHQVWYGLVVSRVFVALANAGRTWDRSLSCRQLVRAHVATPGSGGR